jgi:EAL domain-containing protein (putative c-di-GMP-specific phosphodiesterase class I)
MRVEFIKGIGKVLSQFATPFDVEHVLALDLNLARAIAGSEIGVHYQPKVDVRTGIIRGVEVLARWNLAGVSAVRPDHFIALAEREGLILALTRSVMAQALQQAALWNTMGLKLSIAINLWPRVLNLAPLADEICALARQFLVGAEQVVLGITESLLVDCRGAALGVLNRLRLHGFGLSIDDDGTGFSSMQQLSQIPFTELKVDGIACSWPAGLNAGQVAIPPAAFAHGTFATHRNLNLFRRNRQCLA